MDLKTLKETINKWLSIDDEEWLDIIIACAIDRKVKGDPLWLFVVAVPSSTKTEILRAFPEGPEFYHLSSLTANSFISGMTYKEGGKLRKVEDMAVQINGKVLILKDFTSVLTMAKEKRDEIIGQFREFYDGYYEKKVGSLDKKISVKSNFGLLAGVTPEIDRYTSIMGKLGERFLKVRSDFDDKKMLELCDINSGNESQMRREISKAMEGLLKDLKINDVKLSKEILDEIKKYAQFVARMRAPNNSRWEGSNMVEYLPSKPEKPARIYKQLIKITKCLCIIYGLKHPSRLILDRVWRVSKDSVPPDRMAVYQALLDEGTLNFDHLRVKTNIPPTSSRRIIHVMKESGLIDGKFYDERTNEFYLVKEYLPPCINLGLVTQKNKKGVYIPVFPDPGEAEKI